MYMYIYITIYIHINIYIYTCVYVYIHIYIYLILELSMSGDRIRCVAFVWQHSSVADGGYCFSNLTAPTVIRLPN